MKPKDTDRPDVRRRSRTGRTPARPKLDTERQKLAEDIAKLVVWRWQCERKRRRREEGD
jgi:hypothetical protein